MSITLYTKDGLEANFDKENSDLKAMGDFKRAVVTSGIWIFYSYKDFNKAHPGATKSNFRILKPGADDKGISTVNGSMYLVQDEVEGFILFEHSYYGGKHMYYRESCNDVNSDFPVGQVGGVSSAIILSQNQIFVAFQKPNYQDDGLHHDLEAGKWYATPAEMHFPNDTLRSIKKK